MNLALLTQRVEEACKKVEQHDLDINGNHKPGLKGQMIEANATLKAQDGILRRYGNLLWGVVTAVFLAAVAAYLDLLVW